MMIHTLWATRTFSQDEPELLEAWDEFSVDANFEGWEAAKQAALDSLGTDLHEHRVIDILVPAPSIRSAFDAPSVHGKVV